MNHDHVDIMLRTMVAAMSGSIVLIVIARRIQMSAIVLLLLGGVALGPVGVGIVQPQELGDGLLVIVSLAVGLILFEGGLTLEVEGYRSASGVIRRLLTVGVLVTWLGTAAIAKWLFGLDLVLALLAGSLVIVTGPTVIAPMLKRIRLTPRLNHVLHWEGVLIDPIGVFVAILCFEWVTGHEGRAVLTDFGIRLLGGLVIGVAGGLAIDRLIRRRIVPEDMVNVFALAAAILIFGLAEVVRPETGLLAVTVAGFVLGVRNPVELEQIRRFKSQITELAVGVLFILLAARLEPAQFVSFGVKGAVLVALVMVVIRPANILAASLGSDVTWRERMFLAWMAPRGIVAASMASLFALRLEHDETVTNAKFIETFTYSVIVATVILQGFTAGPLAGALKLKAPAPTGWLIVGAHALGRQLARFIRQTSELAVFLVDTNPKAVTDARREGLEACIADARDTDLHDREDMQAVGNLLALTDNDDLNLLLAERWADVLGRAHVFHWSPEKPKDDREAPSRTVWPDLPKPSLLSAELTRGEAAMLRRDQLRCESSPWGTPIAALCDQRITLEPADLDVPDETDISPVLYLRREADYLLRSLQPELVMRLDIQDQRALFEAMIDRVVAAAPKVDREATVTQLLERERAFPTALGHAVAVPHAHCGGLDVRLCAVAQLDPPLPFGALDGEDVRLVLLLISPQGDPEGHLATMAEIARMVSDPKMRERLFAATEPAELLAVIRQFRPA